MNTRPSWWPIGVAWALAVFNAAGDVVMDDAFIRSDAEGKSWTIGTRAIELTLECRAEGLRTVSFKNKLTDPSCEYVNKDTGTPPFALEANRACERFTLTPVWSKYLPANCTADPAADQARLAVKRGELIGFAVGPHGSYQGDQTQWITELEYEDGESYSSAQDTALAQGPVWYYYVHQPDTGFMELMDAVELQSVAQERVRIPSAASGNRADGDVPHAGATMLHPSPQFDAVRVWKAPKDGRVTVRGKAQHMRGFSDVDLEILRIAEKPSVSPTDVKADHWQVKKVQAGAAALAGRPVAQLELVLSRPSLEPATVTLRLVAFPRSSIIRQWVELNNLGAATISPPGVQPFRIQLWGAQASEFDQRWMIGANCNSDQGTIPGKRLTDSYRHVLSDNGSRQLVPWTAFQRREKGRDGWFLMFDQEGPWRLTVDREHGGAATVTAQSYGFKTAPGQSDALPVVTLGVYQQDFEDMGRRVYDWNYEYLWDYTHHDWYGRTLHLDEFNRYWTEKNWNLQEKLAGRLAMVMASAEVMLGTGMETLWDDIAWWEGGGLAPFSGPDFAQISRFLTKGGMKQIGYFTGMPGLPVLENKVGAWGNFQWRTDFCSWGRGNAGSVTPRAVKTFLEAYPRCAFHSCNGGGGYNHGFEVQRLADVNQMSDASPDQSNYYFSYLEIPDKWQNTFGAGEGAKGKFDWAIHRRILTHVPSWYATPAAADQEAVRNTVDVYHYLMRNGVAGRWSYMFHPAVQGDQEYYYAQRTSYDRERACIILKHQAKGPVTIYPRGLEADYSYQVGFASAKERTQRTGGELMTKGITLTNSLPGELIFLGWSYWPGGGLDKTAPVEPSRVWSRREVNAGFSGVSLYWSPGSDDQWVSHYEIRRGNETISKASARTYFFDRAPGWDANAAYALRTVDGDGNASPWKPATPFQDEPFEAQALGGHFNQAGRNGWSAETSPDGVNFQPMAWTPPGEPGEAGGLDGYWEGAGTARVGRGWQQASATAQCVRAWTAPEAGTVRVIGRAVKEFWHRYGNPLRVRILHGARPVWPNEGWAQTQPNDLTGCAHDFELNLARGDTIRFVLDNGSSPADELLAWMPRIVYQTKRQSASEGSVVRIRCGATEPYADGLGNAWAADEHFTGGHPVEVKGLVQGVQPTAEDTALYCGGRAGEDFTYSIPVVSGLYSLRLKFAELEHEWSFERPFNLDINGRRVLSNLDICQAARGRARAYEQVFRYLVPDGAGRFVLRFTGGFEPVQKSKEAIVQAIELVPELKPVVRIHCGSATNFIDWNGFVWSADRYFDGGNVVTWTDAAGADRAKRARPSQPEKRSGKETCSPPYMSTQGDPAIVEVTPTLYDQALYQCARVGKSFRYTVPAPPGLYSVHLKFAELWRREKDGGRDMKIEVNGRTIRDHWDPASVAGQIQAAMDVRAEDVVPDRKGNIVIRLSASGENEALLQGIEIE